MLFRSQMGIAWTMHYNFELRMRRVLALRKKNVNEYALFLYNIINDYLGPVRLKWTCAGPILSHWVAGIRHFGGESRRGYATRAGVRRGASRCVRGAPGGVSTNFR